MKHQNLTKGYTMSHYSIILDSKAYILYTPIIITKRHSYMRYALWILLAITILAANAYGNGLMVAMGYNA